MTATHLSVRTDVSLDRSSGEYVRFLHDDDFHAPTLVRAMLMTR